MTNTAELSERIVENRSLYVYLKEIGQTPLLSLQEERKLARKVRRGDRDAFTKLIEANLRFVVNIAKCFQHYGVPLLDLINEGNIGLIKAVHHFKVTKGVRFISYAVWWIKQAILSAVHEQRNIVHIPINKASDYSMITRTETYLWQVLERKPTQDEISTETGLSLTDINKTQQFFLTHFSLDQSPTAEEEDKTLGDLLEDKKYCTEDIVYQNALREDVKRAILILPAKEYQVIIMRFGLNSHPPMTLDEVGKKLKVSRERVRQIEKRALQRLQRPLRDIKLREYVA